MSAFTVPTRGRITTGPYASSEANGKNGAFEVKLKHNQIVMAVASDGGGWEHVSVSRADRIPTWDEMCQIKTIFWGEDVWVMQYHPAATDYVNFHPRCLHLWRPTAQVFPTPPTWMVGPVSHPPRGESK